MAVLRDALPVELVANFVGAQWTKLVINQVNALPAITGLSVQQVVGNRGLRRVMTASMRECVRIGLASRIRFERLQGLGHGGLRLFSIAPLWVGQLLPMLMASRMGAVPTPARPCRACGAGS